MKSKQVADPESIKLIRELIDKSIKMEQTLYSIALQHISGLQVGETRIVDAPVKLLSYRKYVNEISKRTGVTIRTPKVGRKLHISRLA
jgi:hypothetical protein